MKTRKSNWALTIFIFLRDILLYISGGIIATARWLWARRAWWWPKLMAAVLITVLTVILLLAFLRLWGKTMAEYSEDCFITSIYNRVRENECAQNAIRELRESKFWKGARQSLFSPSGDSLEPVEYILGLLGAVSVFLSTINEVLSTRSKGILMKEVAKHLFPLHGIFQIFLYPCFAVMGGYAVKKEIVLTTGLCILGLSICFLYSFIMAWKLALSQKAKDHCVNKYFLYTVSLPFVMQWPKKCYRLPLLQKCVEKAKSKSMLKWKNDGQRNVMDFAEYIGQQHCRNTKPDKKSKTLEYRLVDGVCRWLNEEPSKKRVTQLDTALSSAFEELFKCANVDVVEQGASVLYTQCFPEAESEAVKTYKLNVMRSSLVWERLLDSIQDNQRKARLAYFVLAEAQKQDDRTFANLSGGLLQWLRLADCGIAPSELEQNLEEKINFLLQIRQAAQEHSVTREEVRPFLNAWNELMCVAMLILGCMEHLRPEIKSQYGNCRKATRNFIESNIPMKIVYQSKTQYAVYGYLIFSIENYDICKSGAVYVLNYVRDCISNDSMFKITSHSIMEG